MPILEMQFNLGDEKQERKKHKKQIEMYKWLSLTDGQVQN